MLVDFFINLEFHINELENRVPIPYSSQGSFAFSERQKMLLREYNRKFTRIEYFEAICVIGRNI